MEKKIRLLVGCAIILTALLSGLDASKPLRSLSLEASCNNPRVETVQNRYASVGGVIDPRVWSFVFPPIRPRPDEPPDEPANPVPSNGAAGVSTSDTLSVSVTHPLGDIMNVGFYEVPIVAPENFTLITLPDTQFYSESHPDIFTNQTRWIVDTKDALNTVFVTHEGDIVNTSTSNVEWQRANTSLSLLDGVVPWAIAPGNHDGFDDGNITNYNTYFGIDRFVGYSWYGGAYQDNNTNSFQLFSGGSDDYLILHLQFAPNDGVLAWANATIDSYPNRRVIVTTHSYLNVDGSRTGSGENIWQKFVKHHADQIFLVLAGHVPGEGRRTDIVDGHPVYQLLADYQSYQDGPVYGGNGRLRVLSFRPREGKIYVSTYSPYSNTYETNDTSQFTLDYNMTYSFPQPTLIGRAENVASGQRATVQWNRLEYNTTYRWFAVATDTHGKSTSSVIWNFTTTGHDLAIASIVPTKTLVCQGYPLSINVTVRNSGIFPETFDLSLYGNATCIWREEDILLPAKQWLSMMIEWNTTLWDTGHWVLSSTVENVQNEEKVRDASLIYGLVLVTTAGDIAPEFGSVDILDVVHIATAFGSSVGEPTWNPCADIDNNGRVDVFDIFVVADHFGQQSSWE